MSYIGTTEIGKMFLGDVEIDKAYLGNDLVFSGAPQLTLIVHPSSYDTTNSVFANWQSGYPATNAYADASSTSQSRAKWATGSYAETRVFWKFDLSSLPVSASIVSVSVVVNACLSTTSGQSGSYLCVCEGTTEKGTHTNVTAQSLRQFTLDVGTGWTRQSIQDLSVMFYTIRTNRNTSHNYYQIFNGANLTVTYTE